MYRIVCEIVRSTIMFLFSMRVSTFFFFFWSRAYLCNTYIRYPICFMTNILMTLASLDVR
ncbi:uncharacterized protein EURHEDRAFT_218502 [Aspergillus ruber CBS 135680]|uniref:Uncharacterized protein n=1 Tax=Aspergillus ruber (strain CBS 135680) TaxID=1388766 RepID=A0A017SNW0_ASPRC|nr:uncharacterized protein EURHEDRAFT_218502 [Aspergillus ruber CBS 135680]EYE98622.1 hypothetical protein EURHEDRAFT_218502 [Aspergillus ruber CBS 135680]